MPQSNLYHSTIIRAYKRLTPIVKNKKSASYFTVTLSLLTLSFFGLFAVRPTLITVVSLIKTVSDLKKLNIDYENKISSLIRAQAEYEGIRDNLPLVYAAIPPKSSFHTLAATIEDFAQKSNLEINQLQLDNAPISRPASPSGVKKLGFTLVATGNYPSIYSYLNHMLNWKRIVTINALDFAQEGERDGGNLRITVKGNAYYEP